VTAQKFNSKTNATDLASKQLHIDPRPLQSYLATPWEHNKQKPINTMKICNYKSEFFKTVATYRDGNTMTDSFINLEMAKLYRDEVLMKQDNIKEVEIMELLSTATK
jgi:hypothetical protein